MKIPKIPRQTILKETFEFLSEIITENKSGQIVYCGKAGTGKSTLSKQIPLYLNRKGLFPHIIQLQVREGDDLCRLIENHSAIEHKMALIKNSDYRDGFSEKNVKEALVLLKNPHKDFLMVVIDDAHLLNHVDIETLEKIFHPDLNIEPMVLLLLGRPCETLKTDISVSPFSSTELTLLLENILDANWLNLNPSFTKWVQKITEGNPYKVRLLLADFLNRGIIRNTTVPNPELLAAVKLPEDLLATVKSSYSLSVLPPTSRDLILILACAGKELSIEDLSEISGIKTKLLKKTIGELIQNLWIQDSDSAQIKLYHSLLADSVLDSISQNERQQTLRKILNSDYAGDPLVKMNHLTELDILTEAELDSLRSISFFCMDQNQFLTALPAFKKLVEVEPVLGHIHPLLKIYVKYPNFDDQTALFEILNKNSELRSHPVICFYKGKFFMAQGEFQSALKWVENGFGLIDDSDELYADYLELLCWLTFKLNEQDKLKIHLNQLSVFSKTSKKAQLLRLYVLCKLNSPEYARGYLKNYAKKGIQLSKSLKDDAFMSQFYQTLVQDLINNGNLKQAEKLCDEAESFCKEKMDLYYLAAIQKTRAVIFHQHEFFGLAIQHQQQAVNLRKSRGDLYDLIDLQQGLMTMIGNSGHLQRLRNSAEELEKSIKGAEKSLVIVPEFSLAAVYKLLGEKQKALKIFSKIIKYTKANGIAFLNQLTLIDQSTLLFEKNPDKAEKQFDAGIQFLVQNKIISMLKPSYFDWCFMLAEIGQTEKLKKTYTDWQKHEPENETTFAQSAVQILIQILDRKFPKAFTLLSELEGKYFGNYTFEHYRLYKWLNKRKLGTKQFKQRIERLSTWLNIICNHKKVNLKPVTDYQNPFERFMQEWARSINADHIFDVDILDDYTQDKSQRDKLRDTLSVWGIRVRPIQKPEFTDTGHFLNIQLLGKPALTVNDQKVTKKQWRLKKAFPIFQYIIIKSWILHQPIFNQGIRNLFWDHGTEKQKKTQNLLNTTIAKIRKVLDKVHPELLLRDEEKVEFNWDLDCYNLDMDIFWKQSGLGLEQIQSGNLKMGLSCVETALHLYKGMLCEGTEGEWIEAMCSAFHHRYLDCIDELAKLKKNKTAKALLTAEIEKGIETEYIKDLL